jgi:hypothetical protein
VQQVYSAKRGQIHETDFNELMKNWFGMAKHKNLALGMGS